MLDKMLEDWKDKMKDIEKRMLEAAANHNFLAGQLDAAKAMVDQLQSGFDKDLVEEAVVPAVESVVE